MGAIKYLTALAVLILCINRAHSTCVFASDFGFTLDCAFKKSGLFRVRNLGGIKAHVGLGFSVGDELGFGQSLTNLDTSKRRSVSAKNGAPPNSLALLNQQTQQKTNTAKPKPKKNRLTVRQPSTAAPVTQSTTTTIAMVTEPTVVQTGRSQSMMRQMPMAKPQAPALPPFKPIPPAQGMLAPAPTKQSYTQYSIPSQVTQKATTKINNQRIPQNDAPRIVTRMAEQQNTQSNQNRIGQLPRNTIVGTPMRVNNVGQNLMSVSGDQALRMIPAPSMSGASGQFPNFHAMPSSVSKISTSIQVDDGSSKYKPGVSIVSPQAYKNTVQVQLAPSMMSKIPTAASYTQNTLSLRKLPVAQGPIYSATQFGAGVPQGFVSPQQNQYLQMQAMMANNAPTYSPKPAPKIDNYNYNSNNIDYPQQSSLYQKILAISKATNISVEAIEAAIKVRQQQLINQMINIPPSTTTTTTTTSPRPPPPPPPPKRYTKPSDTPTSKVMNAPKEYYPVGYDKNFDDNFVSKVELPETSFYCGDQKHFPGLYGDEDLGCMVFHVCALTDEGLIMKSFLCPESTLFDQTILKCNWWFYVDCKSSKRLYDSNIPVSKSYQLMKALTFFSSYKKEIQGDDPNSNVARSTIIENTEGVHHAVKILQNQPHTIEPRVEIVESKSNRTYRPPVIRNSKRFTPVNVNEVNALSAIVQENENVATEKVEPFTSIQAVNVESQKKETTTERLTATTKNSVIQKIEATTSTEKSMEKSTSVERGVRRRRPGIYINKSKEITPKEVVSTSTSKPTGINTTNTHRRTERASEEVTEAVPTKAAEVHVTSSVPQLNKKEVTSPLISHVVTPNRTDADATIAKMDEAIIG